MTTKYSYKINPVQEAYKFYQQYYRHVNKIGYDWSKQSYLIDQEDIEQECFIKAEEILHSWKSGGLNSTSLIYAYLRKKIITWVKRFKSLIVLPYACCDGRGKSFVDYTVVGLTGKDKERYDIVADERQDIGQEFDRQVIIGKVEDVLSRMPGKYREVLCRYYGIGTPKLSGKELAKYFNVSDLTARHWIEKAKKNFKRVLTQYEVDNIGDLLDYEA